MGVFNFDESEAGFVLRGVERSRVCRRIDLVHVFDFWNKEYLGAWEKGISVDLMPNEHESFYVDAGEDQMQLVSTSRHITQGWVDLISHITSSGNRYSGKSRLIKNDPYNLRFAFPRGKNFAIKSATAYAPANCRFALLIIRVGPTAEITSPVTTEVSWEVRFRNGFRLITFR